MDYIAALISIALGTIFFQKWLQPTFMVLCFISNGIKPSLSVSKLRLYFYLDFRFCFLK